MRVICIRACNTNAIISVTRYQIEIKLSYRNEIAFILNIISFNYFKELML